MCMNEGDALGWENQGPSAQERAAFHGTKLAHFRPTPIYDSGSSLRRAGALPYEATCRPAATQRDGMPPVTERDGIGPATQRGGMTPAEPAKSQAALQPMHCVRRAGRDGRLAAKVDSQGRKPQEKAGWEGKSALQPMHCVRHAARDGRVAAKVDKANGPTPSRMNRWPVGPKLCFDRARPQGRCPRCTTQVKDPSGLVPLVNKVEWLRQASAKTTDPHVLVTWVKEIGGHAQAGEPHSPSGRAGRGLDAHSVSVVAFQPRSPAGQAGRGLDCALRFGGSLPTSFTGRASRPGSDATCVLQRGRCPGLGEPRAFGPGTCRVSRNKTGTLPTHSGLRFWVEFAQGRRVPLGHNLPTRRYAA